MYHNPVIVAETNNWASECSKFQKHLGIRKPLIITSQGNARRHRQSKVFIQGRVFSDVSPNPTFESCQNAIDFGMSDSFDGIIALGGGSVMDTAKTVVAAISTDIINLRELLEIKAPFKDKVPSVFIPTTHGSGSEVTMWGTIWSIKEKKKYSISNPDLYPDVAILDGFLTLTLPLDISLITALDALSHSFESIWNKNSNLKSTEHAIEAICLILDNTERLKKNPKDYEVRKLLLKGSCTAGLAFSNTKTAAAHSISYPLTLYFGIPHGIASSISLIPLLDMSAPSIEHVLKDILRRLNLDNVESLKKRIKRVSSPNLKNTLRQWGVKIDELDWLAEKSFTKGRMDNYIFDLEEKNIKNILKEVF